jgi:superoxide dismutase, Fe-Mn family
MYTEQPFNLPENLIGISQTNITEHLKLYSGYVKHTNLILETLAITPLSHASGEGSGVRTVADAYAHNEIRRRYGFEYNGMKNHEYYFQQLEGGSVAMSPESALAKKITTQFGSVENWLTEFQSIAMTRGIGWAIMYYDTDHDTLHNIWVDEQHLGHLNSAQFIVGIDMWEHAYVSDYLSSGKKQYIADYLANINWSVVETRFENCKK